MYIGTGFFLGHNHIEEKEIDMESIWRKSVAFQEREKLPGDRQVHTVVIGAGIAGILTAYFLQKRGMEVVVVEAKTIASGQTENTTAKITSQHGMIYEKLIRKVGSERARAYAQANEEAIRLYEKMIEKENIACHFQKLPAYLYSVHESAKEKLKKEAQSAAGLGIAASFVEGDRITELPFYVSGAVCFENQAQFHPLEFLKHLAKGLTIYENTKVLSVKEHMVYTSRGDIRAENIVFACHYPIVNVPGFYFLRQHQERSYVLALKGQKELSGMYYSVDENGLSLRSAGDTLLLGGGGHRTGKSHTCICRQSETEGAESGGPLWKAGMASGKETATGYAFLRQMAKTFYPKAMEAGAWSAQDCMPHDDIPFIGRYSMLRPYWYVATGFKKWGMTSAMVAAVNISNLICGEVGTPDITLQESMREWETQGSITGKNVFTPQRCLVRAAFRNLMIDVGESIMGLGKGLFCKKERRCPHMGCKLEWNMEEGSLECPCHGSRFGGDGELLDNPAQVDMGEKE